MLIGNLPEDTSLSDNGYIPYFLKLESELLEKADIFISYRLFNKKKLLEKKIVNKNFKISKNQTLFYGK